MLEYKYKTLSEFKNDNPKEYNSLKYKGLLERLCNDMNWVSPKKTKPNGYWTPETIFEESKKYKTTLEWKKNSSSSYSMSFKFEGLYSKCLDEMGITRPKPIGFWDIKQNVLEEALKFKSKTEWQEKSNGSMKSARKNDWLEECCQHMK